MATSMLALEHVEEKGKEEKIKKEKSLLMFGLESKWRENNNFKFCELVYFPSIFPSFSSFFLFSHFLQVPNTAYGKH